MGDGEPSLQLWNVETGVAIMNPIRLPRDAEIMFSHDETALMAVGGHEVSLLWHPGATNQRLVKIEPEKTGFLHDAAFSPDNTVIAITAEDRSVRTWNALSGKPISPPIIHREQIAIIEFSTDGRLLATASEDRSVRIWDAVSGEAVAAPMWHSDKLESMKFQPDSRTIETLSRDGIQRIWSVSADDPAQQISRAAAVGSNECGIQCGRKNDCHRHQRRRQRLGCCQRSASVAARCAKGKLAAWHLLVHVLEEQSRNTAARSMLKSKRKVDCEQGRQNG